MDKSRIAQILLTIPPCMWALLQLTERIPLGFTVPTPILELVTFLGIASMGLLIIVRVFDSLTQIEPEALCYLAPNTPIIDGAWTSPTEWVGAQEYVMRYGDACFRAMHDLNFIYFMIDVLREETVHKDSWCWIYLDGRCDRSRSPNEDDIAFSLQWETTNTPVKIIQRGNGTHWGQETRELPEGFAVSSSLRMAQIESLNHPHLTYEFKIPKSVVGLSTKMGLRIALHDASRFDPKQHKDRYIIVWPRMRETESSRDVPKSWGVLRLLHQYKGIALGLDKAE